MKIFCIGFNKTGTTSLQYLLKKEGFLVSNQFHFEQNLDSYIAGNYSTFINMIKTNYSTSNVFQDVPFSLPNLYKHLYKEFPNSYYILTVRDNSEMWYNSLLNYYKNLFPNRFYISHKIEYIREGWIYDYLVKGLNSPSYDPYNKLSLIKSYENHNSDVQRFFKDKKNFIKINLSNPQNFIDLQNFLGVKFNSLDFPHLNKSQ